VAALEPAARRAGDPLAYLAIKGARRLNPRGLAALRELHAWREKLAERTDTPAFRIVGNETLLHLAQERPAKDLRGVPGLPSRLVGRIGRELLDAIVRAAAVPDAQLPSLPRTPRPVVAEAALRRGERLKAWRGTKAAELELDVSVVLPQRLIDRLAEAAPRDATALAAVEGLRRWRVEAFGPELLRAVQ